MRMLGIHIGKVLKAALETQQVPSVIISFGFTYSFQECFEAQALR